MPNHVTSVITLSGDESRIKAMLEQIKNDEYGLGSVDFNKILPMPEAVYCGPLGMREKELHGKNNWYDWRITNWGTKWNSYGYNEEYETEDDKLQFLTAWGAPHPVIQKLSEMYPDIKFEHEWADEDIGNNCGRYVYYDGERIEEYFPESQKDCLEFAANVMDASLEEDYSMYLNATETGYINIEYDDEYELIEVAGHTALFTNERITDADIPKGMYCYHLRGSDSADFYALEKSVAVNHTGSIVTKEPIDFKSKGYIVLDEDSSPNFLGENMSLYEFREYNPDQTEELSMGMQEA